MNPADSQSWPLVSGNGLCLPYLSQAKSVTLLEEWFEKWAEVTCTKFGPFHTDSCQSLHRLLAVISAFCHWIKTSPEAISWVHRTGNTQWLCKACWFISVYVCCVLLSPSFNERTKTQIHSPFRQLIRKTLLDTLDQAHYLFFFFLIIKLKLKFQFRGRL